MTLLDRILARGVELPMDPIIATRLERHLRRIQPDPLFRRRLRGQVLNRYVAAREGLVPAPTRPAVRGEMGRLGRGVLYASLLTAMSVTAVGAASQSSLPGDALYGIKLELEEIRMQVAPPGLRDDLAILALDQRLREVELLAEAGRWALVDEAAARAVQAEEALATILGSEHVNSSVEARQAHADRLAELMATAPASAIDGLERALEASTADAPPAVVPPQRPNPGRTVGGNSGGSNSGSPSGSNSGSNNGGSQPGGTDPGGPDAGGPDPGGTGSGGNQDDDADDGDSQGGVQGEDPDVELPEQPSQPSEHAPSAR